LVRSELEITLDLADMTNQPLNPAQPLLMALRDLAFAGSPGRWVAVMFLLSIPIAFGVAVSTLVDTLVDTLILPILTLPLGNLRLWMIPLGTNMMGVPEVARGIYIGAFIVALVKFFSTIGVLFGLIKLLKSFGSRLD
jgi:large-conductance mechanosensitive channel